MIKAIIFDLGDTTYFADKKKIRKAVINETGIDPLFHNYPDLSRRYEEKVKVGKESIKSLNKDLIKYQNKKINTNFLILP